MRRSSRGMAGTVVSGQPVATYMVKLKAAGCAYSSGTFFINIEATKVKIQSTVAMIKKLR